MRQAANKKLLAAATLDCRQTRQFYTYHILMKFKYFTLLLYTPLYNYTTNHFCYYPGITQLLRTLYCNARCVSNISLQSIVRIIWTISVILSMFAVYRKEEKSKLTISRGKITRYYTYHSTPHCHSPARSLIPD